MTGLTPAETAGFARRATALLIHFGEGDIDGIRAVLEECRTGADTTYLVIAVLGLIEHLAPQTFTPAGMAIVRDVVADLARQEHA
jgi:hypothetical protein